MPTLLSRLLTAAALLLSSWAAAQISSPPTDLARTLRAGLSPAGTTLTLGSARAELALLDGLLWRLEYHGPAGDTATAARVLAVASGYADAQADVQAYLERARATLIGKGPQIIGLSASFDLMIDWNDELGFTLALRAYPDVGGDRHLLGRAGPVIREFSDFECPYCRQLYREVLPSVKRELIDSGLARFSYRQLPLTSIHPRALPLALGSECAARQGQFFAFHDLAFERGAQASAQELARSLQLEESAFSRCLEDPQVAAVVRADLEAAERLRLEGTPSVFVGPFLLPDPYDTAAYGRFVRMAGAFERR
ncbi:hypothetical protein HNR42_002783 [Deinobacterium chartae]|uniref:Thioredoxin-like fold domain-containing protein n=1 Tax=Deinobacterium chartae TaxID=521158 RepID=A0A841I5Z5_9DEIO|nr:thioredoxin domain-containing protein [Deinobacterium chartae]MBB6099342.1 hypothetical protein [Deinobacterium chartae]